ncbi:hypothetical protein Adt_33677 [Abeliophyllum distichum]|uniref:Uncharacterized protein n=1 Tax=Abeliophyllum distichum TaxID=126358 RepID=A0ABD1QWX5_9LAMI
MIDRYYELNRTGIDPMPTEEDMQSVTRFLYGRENAWHLATSHFKHDELTREIERSIMFPYLISGICLEAGVPLLLFEEADTPEVPLTHKTIDNSEAKKRAREIRARRAPVVQPDEAAHDPAPPIPQPALAVDTNLGIQFTQIQVALTEIGRSMNDMQNTLVGVQHTQNNMQQELL